MTNRQYLHKYYLDSRSESENFLYWKKDIFYSEEFDPGSG